MPGVGCPHAAGLIMRTELAQEVETLKRVLEGNGLEFAPRGGAGAELIAEVEAEVGITFDADLKEFWRMTNGSDRNHSWFAVFSDELTPCSFASVEDARECWSWLSPYDEPVYEEWNDETAVRDARIQPAYLVHRLWFPIAEFNNFSTSVLFDGDPTAEGRYGQIIVYQHDPDAVYYVAESFLEFFRKSNALLEANAKELLL